MLREIEQLFSYVYEQLYDVQETISHMRFTIILLTITVIIQMLMLMCIYSCIQ